MQVQNIQTAQNNNYNPNFKMIKKLELCGLYKKHPEIGRKLVDTFRLNPDAMKFSKKYDVSVYFDALEDGYGRVQSSLYIFYDNPAVSKIKKFFKFLNSSEDKIHIQGYNYDLERSSNALMDHMLPDCFSSTEGNATGVLSSNIKYTDEKIQNALDKKAERKASKLKQTQEKTENKEHLLSETEKTKNSIQELIESTK